MSIKLITIDCKCGNTLYSSKDYDIIQCHKCKKKYDKQTYMKIAYKSIMYSK